MMLTGLYVMVVGGDERQLEVIDRLHELDAIVKAVGFELEQERTTHIHKTLLTVDECASVDVLVLPVTGMSETGEVESKYGRFPIHFRPQHISALPQHAKIYSGFASEYMRNMCTQAAIPYVEMLKRNDLAIFNSIPTAEGAVAMAIEHTNVTIHASKATVLGFGRVGMTLARLLKAMGAIVSTGVRFPEQFARAYEMGLDPFYTNDWYDRLKECDLLFNTIPSMIISAKVIAAMCPHTVIIDLATKPGGTDFRFAEKRQIKALQAPGLPGIVAPKTAGNMFASTLCQLISEDMEATF
jgi:dipicolinate synthase subunit A